jgi:hypothetical protein
MNIPDKLGPVLVLGLTVATFVFLLLLGRSRSTQRNLTVAWFVYGVLFLFMCGLLFRFDPPAGSFTDNGSNDFGRSRPVDRPANVP